MFEDNIFLNNVIVEGEISNYKVNSGHLYFTLKDEQAQLMAVMFKGYAQSLKFIPKDGSKVYAVGSVQVYEKTGRYQLYVTSMKEVGKGDLYQKYEELKATLEMKGYFKVERKRPIPKFPKNIALITSPTGAVIEDLKSIIWKRSQFSNLTLYPTKVQGVDAKYSIVKNIERANNNPLIDCIILARGGGSIEDLWPFNEEIVADAIYNSRLPIISAVGHETDFTISDFVADMRAATPSDAALRVVLDKVDLKNNLDSLSLRLNTAFKKEIDNKQILVDNLNIRNRFKDKNKIFEKKSFELVSLIGKLNQNSPKHKLETFSKNYDNLHLRLNQSYLNRITKLSNNHKLLNEKIIILNPLSILDKGYSVTYKGDELIKDVDNVNVGDIITTKVSKGTIKSKVVEKER